MYRILISVFVIGTCCLDTTK